MFNHKKHTKTSLLKRTVLYARIVDSSSYHGDKYMALLSLLMFMFSFISCSSALSILFSQLKHLNDFFSKHVGDMRKSDKLSPCKYLVDKVLCMSIVCGACSNHIILESHHPWIKSSLNQIILESDIFEEKAHT